MIEWFLSALSMGQAAKYRTEDLYASAAKHIADVENACLACNVRLAQEFDRIERLCNGRDISAEVAIKPLISIQGYVDEISLLAQQNRCLLNSKGASVKVVAELERWAGTCKAMSAQIDLAVQRIESVIHQA
jgi:hypothetical protein